MTKFQYSSWQNLLQEAANETDSGRLNEKVQAAEAAIFLRLQELSVLPGNQQELEALQKACEELLEIQTQRLNWPVNFAELKRREVILQRDLPNLSSRFLEPRE
jgi:hypothetical protein